MLSALHPLVLHAARGRLFSRIVTQLERISPGRPNLLHILMYHRVDTPEAHPDLDPATLGPTPAGFEEQARFLAEHYRVVSMEEVVRAVRGEASLPPRAVLLTFDDAYGCVAEHAWPILKRYGLPVTLFVPTAYPDHPERTFWWDRLYQACTATQQRQAIPTPLGPLPLQTLDQRQQAYQRLKRHVRQLPDAEQTALIDRLCDFLDPPPPKNPVLGWEALRQLAREGVTLAGHTQTHPLLNRVDAARAEAEIRGAFSDLRREVGEVLPVFAYPCGESTDAVVQVLRRLKMLLALTTCRGINDLTHADLLRLKRINVGRSTNLSLLRAQLLSWWPGRNRRTSSSVSRKPLSAQDPSGLSPFSKPSVGD